MGGMGGAGGGRNARGAPTTTVPSPTQPLTALSAPASDVSLPSITIPARQAFSDFSVDVIYAALKFRGLLDTSGAINNLSGAQDIQIQSGGAWYDCINLYDAMLRVQANSEGPGDIIIGDIDISSYVSLVAGNSYAFQVDDALAAGADIEIQDAQMLLIIILN